MASTSKPKLDSGLISSENDEELHTQLSVIESTSTSNNIDNLDNMTTCEMGITLECSVAIGSSTDMNPFSNYDNENLEMSSESERVNLKRKKNPIDNNASDVEVHNEPSTSNVEDLDEVNKKRRIEPQPYEPIASTSSAFMDYEEQRSSPDITIQSASSLTPFSRLESLMSSVYNELVEADDVFIMDLIKTFTNNMFSVADKDQLSEMYKTLYHQISLSANIPDLSLNVKGKLRLIKSMLFKCSKCRRALDLMNNDPNKIFTDSHRLLMHVKKQHLVKNYSKFNKYYLKVVRKCDNICEIRVQTEQPSTNDDAEDNVGDKQSSSETLPIDGLIRSEDNSATVINEQNVNSLKSPTQNAIVSLDLYRSGTDKRKNIDEIIADYKKITSMKELSNIELTDILMAYKAKIGIDDANNSVINDVNTYFETHVLPNYSKNSINADDIINQPIRLSQYSECTTSRVINKKPLDISDFDFSDMDDETDNEPIAIVSNGSKKNKKTTNVPTIAEISVNEIEIEQNLDHSCVPKLSTICTESVKQNTRTTNENNLEKNVTEKKTENKNAFNSDITDSHSSDITEDNCNIPVIEEVIPVDDYTTTANTAEKQVNDKEIHSNDKTRNNIADSKSIKESSNVPFVQETCSVAVYDTVQNCMDRVIENEEFNDDNQARNNIIDSNSVKENFNVPYVEKTCSVVVYGTEQNVTNEVIENEKCNDDNQTHNDIIDSNGIKDKVNVPFVEETRSAAEYDTEQNVMDKIIENEEFNDGVQIPCNDIDSNINEKSCDVPFVEKTTEVSIDVEEITMDTVIESDIDDIEAIDHRVSTIENCDISTIEENVVLVDVYTTETNTAEKQIDDKQHNDISDYQCNDNIDSIIIEDSSDVSFIEKTTYETVHDIEENTTDNGIENKDIDNMDTTDDNVSAVIDCDISSSIIEKIVFNTETNIAEIQINNEESRSSDKIFSNVIEESSDSSFVEEITSIGVYDIDENTMDNNAIENEDINSSGAAINRRRFSAITDGYSNMPVIKNGISVDVHATKTTDMTRKQIDTKKSYSIDDRCSDIIDSDVYVNEIPGVPSSSDKTACVAVPSYDADENTMDNVIQNKEYNIGNATAQDKDMNSGNIEDIFNIPLVERITQMSLYANIGESVADEPMESEKSNVDGSDVGKQSFSVSPPPVEEERVTVNYVYGIATDERAAEYHRTFDDDGDKITSNRCVVEPANAVRGNFGIASPMENATTPAKMYGFEGTTVVVVDESNRNDPSEFDSTGKIHNGILRSGGIEEMFDVPMAADQTALLYGYDVQGGVVVNAVVDGTRVTENHGYPGGLTALPAVANVVGSDGVAYGIPIAETSSATNMTYDIEGGNNGGGFIGTVVQTGTIETYGGIATGHVGDVVVRIDRNVPIAVKSASTDGYDGIDVGGLRLATTVTTIDNGIESGAYGYGNGARGDTVVVVGDPSVGDNMEDIFSMPMIGGKETVDLDEMMAEKVAEAVGDCAKTTSANEPAEERATGGDATIDLTDDDTTIVYYLDNSSDDEVSSIMLNVVKKNESYFKFMLMCDDSAELVCQLRNAGIRLPVNEKSTADKANFVKIYMRWFEGGHGDPDKEYDRWSIGVLKNMIWYMRQRDAMPDDVRRSNEYDTNTALNFLYKSWGKTPTRPKPTANYFKRLTARSSIFKNGVCTLPGNDVGDDDGNGRFGSYGRRADDRDATVYDGGDYRAERAADYRPTYGGSLIGEDRFRNDVVYEDISDDESDAADDDDDDDDDDGQRTTAFDDGQRTTAFDNGPRMAVAAFGVGRQMPTAAFDDGGQRMAFHDGGQRPVMADAFNGGYQRTAMTAFNGGGGGCQQTAMTAFDGGCRRTVTVDAFNGGGCQPTVMVDAFNGGGCQPTTMTAFNGSCHQPTAMTAFNGGGGGQRTVMADAFNGGCHQPTAMTAFNDGGCRRTAAAAFNGVGYRQTPVPAFNCGGGGADDQQQTAVATAFDGGDRGDGSPLLPKATTTAAFYQAVADAIGDCDDESSSSSTVNEMLDNNLDFQDVVNNIKTETAECQQLVNYAEDDDDGMVTGGLEIPAAATVAATNDNIMSTIGFDNAGMLLPS